MVSLCLGINALGADNSARGASKAPRSPAECISAVLSEDFDTRDSAHSDFLIRLDRPDFGGEQIIDFLAGDPELERLFSSDAGVSEGYTIRQHTLMVYQKFSEQLPYFRLNSIQTPQRINLSRLMKVTVALHDIGKPKAISAGNKSLQHSFTIPILTEKLQTLGFSPEEVNIAKAVVDNDVLGELLQGRINVQDAQKKLSRIASNTSLNPKDYFKLQTFFFTIDAASYPYLENRAFRRQSGQLIPTGEPYEQLKRAFESTSQ
jgi:hypothetical protein